MFACKDIFAKPSIASCAEPHIGQSPKTCPARLCEQIIPHEKEIAVKIVHFFEKNMQYRAPFPLTFTKFRDTMVLPEKCKSKRRFLEELFLCGIRSSRAGGALPRNLENGASPCPRPWARRTGGLPQSGANPPRPKLFPLQDQHLPLSKMKNKKRL